MITLIWKAWPQNPEKTISRIESFTEIQTESLIFQYGGPNDVYFRLKKLQTLAHQLHTEPCYPDVVSQFDERYSNTLIAILTSNIIELFVLKNNLEIVRLKFETSKFIKVCQNFLKNIAFV